MEEDNNKEAKINNGLSPQAGVEEKKIGKRGIKSFLPFVWEIIQIVVIALVIVLPIRYFLFQPFIVRGESMVPNLKSGDYLIVDEISYRFTEPQRGNIIVFKYPKDTAQRFIKRIIGLPGETVEIKEGKITIYKNNSFALNEEYLPDDLKTEGDINIVLGPDEYFVLGDNREYSFDSRRWGILSKEYIIGKAYLRIFPITTLSQIETPIY
ncbi:MAG: signal peptidase I [Patescibacteria group bacterium]